ncbi:hypothetical protein DV737_g583, partial [Chaetothyriales sp. CBS 132003]
MQEYLQCLISARGSNEAGVVMNGNVSDLCAMSTGAPQRIPIRWGYELEHAESISRHKSGCPPGEPDDAQFILSIVALNILQLKSDMRFLSQSPASIPETNIAVAFGIQKDQL